MRWREALGVGGLFLVVGLAYLWVRAVELPMLHAPDGHYVLADPDSFMRWRLVTRALDGEGVRIRWMNEDNAPHGRMNEWTSPMTILGVTLARFAETCGGVSRPAALEWAGLWLGPVVGLLSLAALGWLGWRAGGWALAACWMVAWPALGDAVRSTRAGNADHHGLHQLLFVCMIGGCLALGRAPTAMGGTFVGLACALGMWSAGSELLPAWALVAALAVYELWRKSGPSKVRFWRGWWLSGFCGTLAAWLYEFWPAVFHGRLEVLSVWHVIGWGICGAMLECVGRVKKAWPVAVAATLVVVSAGAARGFDWTRLHVMQDELLRRQFAVTAEFRSMLSGGLDEAIGRLWWKYGLLPVLGAWLVCDRVRGGERVRWIEWVAVGYLMLMLYESRWGDFFVVVLTMAVGLGIAQRLASKPWVAIALIAVATLPPWRFVVGASREVRRLQGAPLWSPYAETIALAAASDCLAREGKPTVVLASWAASAKLAGMGRVRVVGTGYWSNLEGLRASHDLFSTTLEQRFWHIVRERQIEYVILPEPVRLERLIRESWYVSNGRLPDGTEWQQAVLWRLFTTDALPRVSCEKLTQRNRHWRIFQLYGVGARQNAPG